MNPTFANRTRTSKSIPRKLIKERKLHFLPVYWLMRLSALGREGIENSGSYRFADHAYRSDPSGRGTLGKLIDRLLLNLRATQAFRERCSQAQTAIRNALEVHSRRNPGQPFHVLSVPCGIPRDVFNLSHRLSHEAPGLLPCIHYCGMDLDPEALRHAKDLLLESALENLEFHHGDALDAQSFPQKRFHCIVSTGLGEFLSDSELSAFYANIYDALEPGGVFYTSATAEDPRSERLLRAFELHTNYRTQDQMADFFGQLAWAVNLSSHPSGLQTFVTAQRRL